MFSLQERIPKLEFTVVFFLFLGGELGGGGRKREGRKLKTHKGVF